MKLTYWGVDYEYDPNQAKINDLDAVGVDRDPPVRLPAMWTLPRHAGLKYRGALYDR